jgi:hypothetical protein
MIYSYKNGKKVYYVTEQDIRNNEYTERRLRTDIKKYTNFIENNPNSTPDQRKWYFDKVVQHVSYSKEMMKYVEAEMETNWMELFTTVLNLMDKELATLDMSDYHERIMIAHPWQWVRHNIVEKRDQCEEYYKKSQKHLREVMRSTFLYGCATQNSGSTNLPLIGARYAYGPIRKQIGEYVGVVDP